MIEKFRCIPWFKGESLNLLQSLPNQDKIPLAIVYTVWGSDCYLDFLRLSLYSQFKYTDAHKAHIKIFVTPDLETKTRDRVGDFPVEVIVKTPLIRKYSILNDDSLSNFEQIVVCDCDTFFYSTESRDLYQKLVKNTNILMLKDYDLALKVLYDRKCLSSMHSSSNDDYDLWFKEIGYYETIPIISELPYWYLSCFMSFPRTAYSGKDWDNLCADSLKCEHGCDETLFILYGTKHDYTFADIGTFLNANTVYGANIGSFLAHTEECINSRTLSVIHPLHGDFCHDIRVIDVFRKIAG